MVRTFGAVALALTTAGLACGGSVLGLDDNGADFVRIAMSVPEGSGPIQYVTSTDFSIRQIDAERVQLTLNVADTVSTALPLDERFPTTFTRRFVFLVLDRGDVEDSIIMTVWLDDRQLLQNEFGSEAELRVLYMFQSGLSVNDFTVV